MFADDTKRDNAGNKVTGTGDMGASRGNEAGASGSGTNRGSQGQGGQSGSGM